MGVEAIDIFEVEPMELANWWVVEIEENGGLGNKAEILSLDDQSGAINKNMEVRGRAVCRWEEDGGIAFLSIAEQNLRATEVIMTMPRPFASYRRKSSKRK